MKKSNKFLIAALILVICGLLAFRYFYPGSKNPDIPADNSASNETTPGKTGENSEEAKTADAEIQEDQGDIIITIPDDQESAGE